MIDIREQLGKKFIVAEGESEGKIGTLSSIKSEIDNGRDYHIILNESGTGKIIPTKYSDVDEFIEDDEELQESKPSILSKVMKYQKYILISSGVIIASGLIYFATVPKVVVKPSSLAVANSQIVSLEASKLAEYTAQMTANKIIAEQTRINNDSRLRVKASDAKIKELKDKIFSEINLGK